MRLTEKQKEAIIQTVTKNFGNDVKIWLFGSRADDSKRGGDVDLYVETTLNDPFMSLLRCKSELKDRLDINVDMVVNEKGKDDPIYAIAKKQGIPL